MNCVNLIYQVDMLSIIGPPIHKHNVSLHLFRYSLISSVFSMLQITLDSDMIFVSITKNILKSKEGNLPY